VTPAADALYERLLKTFKHTPTGDQADTLQRLAAYLSVEVERSALIIRGAAGTGKTSLLQTVVRQLEALDRPYVLMAPTGRAAKVMARTTRRQAFTLHSRIYQTEARKDGQLVFRLRTNEDEANMVYIVDEASMVGDTANSEGGLFSTGHTLLRDLLDHVYEDGRNRKLLLVGDHAQLPPIGAIDSPALDRVYLRKHYDLKVGAQELNEVKRQVLDSGILLNATRFREAQQSVNPQVPKLLAGGEVVQLQDAGDVLETFLTYYNAEAPEQVVVLTHSNKMATRINEAVRGRLFPSYEPSVDGPPQLPSLAKDDFVMVVKNAYSVPRAGKDTLRGPIPFLANGETGTVVAVEDSSIHEKYGIKWCRAELAFSSNGRDEDRVDTLLPLDLLTSQFVSMPSEQAKQLYAARFAELKAKKPSVTKPQLRADPYLNALQLKFGYAVTGHKAQGGQWQHVIVVYEPSLLRNSEEEGLRPFLRWCYTAFTRASERLYLYGFPDDMWG
jgi:exodeoxyribonuclease V